MKKSCCALITILCSLFISGAAVVYTENLPSETALLDLPENAGWKEIARNVTQKQGVIERIPLNQNIENWSDLIAIQYQYIDRAVIPIDSMDTILALLERPSTNATGNIGFVGFWKIIEKNKTDAIYEQLVATKTGKFFEHQISRVFLTEKGFHLVGFTKRDQIMESKESAKWIELLKKNVSIVAWSKAFASTGLSMVEHLVDSLSLGPHFQNWTIKEQNISDDGFAAILRTPPSQTKSILEESLIISSVPNIHEYSLEKVFENEKERIRKHLPDVGTKFRILKKTEKELIFYYVAPDGLLQRSEITRIIFTDYGYYIIIYESSPMKLLSNQEIAQWQAKLETIQIR